MALKIKEGVHFTSIEMAMNTARAIINQVCDDYGIDCVITGGVEEHKWPSKHLYGALDFRSRDLNQEVTKRDFANDVRSRLGSWFTFLYEDGPDEHFHCQYPPKGKGL